MDIERMPFNTSDILWKIEETDQNEVSAYFIRKVLKESMKMNYKYFYSSSCTCEIRFIRTKKINL